jgi:hypothetical protein
MPVPDQTTYVPEFDPSLDTSLGLLEQVKGVVTPKVFDNRFK